MEIKRYVVVRTISAEITIIGFAVDTLQSAQSIMLTDMAEVKDNMSDNDFELWKNGVTTSTPCMADSFGSDTTSAWFIGRDTWNWAIKEIDVYVDELRVPLSEGELVLYSDAHDSEKPTCGIMYETPDKDPIDIVFIEQYESPSKFEVYFYEDITTENWTSKTEYQISEIKKVLKEDDDE